MIENLRKKLAACLKRRKDRREEQKFQIDCPTCGARVDYQKQDGRCPHKLLMTEEKATTEEKTYTPALVLPSAESGLFKAQGTHYPARAYDYAFGGSMAEAAANYDRKMKEIEALKSSFVALDREKAAHKKFYEDYDAALAKLADVLGLDQYFQDDEGIVYKTEKPSGTYVAFKDVGISRTRRTKDGETKGSLSMKEATEAGFELPNEKALAKK